MSITEIAIHVTGRPAPQGSKRTGAAGQMREASPYLPAWRAAVVRDAYRTYSRLDIAPGDLPVFRGPVACGITFWLPPDVALDGPPDLDKLVRAVWDALGPPAPRRRGESAASYARRNVGRGARLWEDDARVVEILWASKARPLSGEPTGADIHVESRADRR